MMSKKKAGIFSSFLWRLFELIGSQGVSFIVSIILARKLLPSDYGVVAIVSVIISIVDIFATKGFGTALIQKKDADTIDFSTVFYFNIAFTVVLYGLMFLCAPQIAIFYGNQEITLLIRVLCIRILFSGVNSVQQAYIAKRMEFKKFFFATFGGTLISAVVGIVMAYTGFGAWALVWQYLVNVIVDTIVLWIISGWRPTREFSSRRLKGLFQYGWKIMCAGLLGTFYNNLQSIIIGKKYTEADLAYYSKGKQLPQTIISSISVAMEGVMFPAMSNCQNVRGEVKTIAKKSITMSTYITFPVVMGLFAVADSLIVLLFTEKWINCIPLLRVACAVYIMWPVQTVNLQIIKALGRSDIFLKLDIYKKVMGVVGLVVGMTQGLWGIIVAEAICSILSAIIDMFPVRKLIAYGCKEQIRDISNSFVCALIMSILVIGVGQWLSWGILIEILIQIIVGVVSYIVLSVVLRNKCLYILLNTLKVCKSKA